jgi:hypothetical protein
MKLQPCTHEKKQLERLLVPFSLPTHYRVILKISIKGIFMQR